MPKREINIKEFDQMVIANRKKINFNRRRYVEIDGKEYVTEIV